MKVRSALAIVALAGLVIAAPGLATSAPMEDCAGREGPNKLTVQVLGLHSTLGEVVVTLYPNDPHRFLLPHGKLLRQRVKADAPSACFWLPSSGVYAVAVYHDANGDHDFNRNALGLPTEGFGFSNDPPTKYGVPSFAAVRFTAKPGLTGLKIPMHYLH
jgi:uncharacterized protein (DUF2141 family)